MARNEGKPVNKHDSTTDKTEKGLDCSELSAQWKQIDWEKAEQTVNRLQVRIAKATENHKWNVVKRLQYLLTHSHYAKVLAAKKVTTNKGKRTPGVDKKLWQSPSEKMAAALSLTDKRYKAKPLRRIYIQKKNKKAKRPLSIPCMYDRAMQALYAMALQPVAETTADRNSYGFRKYRSCQDACEHAFTALSRRFSPEWILEGDIKGCFDHISHQWLIDNIPMDKSVLKQFLKAGFVYNRVLYPTKEGTLQGGIISPILANMTLDGIQSVLAQRFDTGKAGKISQRAHNRNQINFIRYADDFIVTARTKELAEEAKEIIREFLRERGLELSEEKTVITNIHDGFDLLGWTFRKFKDKLIIKPSNRSMRSLTDSLSEIILKKGSALKQEELIRRINPKLTGWGNYHKSICAKRAFQKADMTAFTFLWKWACRRHPRKGKTWIKNRYWHSKNGRNWMFMTEDTEMKALSYVPIKRRPKLNTAQNPYLNQEYFLTRKAAGVSKDFAFPNGC